MTKPNPKCPECDKPFKTVQLMSMHRAIVHKVAGKSKEAIRLRAERRAKKQAEWQAASPITTPPVDPPPPPPPPSDPPKDGTFVCPECGVVFSSKSGLGIHRKAIHGVRGAVYQKRMIDIPGSVNCTLCDFVAKTPNGLGIHLSTKHKEEWLKSQEQKLSTPKELRLERTTQATALAVRPNGHAPYQDQRQADPNAIPEATIALGLGRLQGFCGAMAQEFNLPPRSLAAELARAFYATQVR